MKRCWDHDPENRPTAEETEDRLWEYYYGHVTNEKKE